MQTYLYEVLLKSLQTYAVILYMGRLYYKQSARNSMKPFAFLVSHSRRLLFHYPVFCLGVRTSTARFLVRRMQSKTLRRYYCRNKRAAEIITHLTTSFFANTLPPNACSKIVWIKTISISQGISRTIIQCTYSGTTRCSQCVWIWADAAAHVRLKLAFVCFKYVYFSACFRLGFRHLLSVLVRASNLQPV